jgi:hypothetical protein
MKNISVVLLIGLIFFSVSIMTVIAQSPKQEQEAPSAEMKKEVEKLAGRFIESLHATGNLRNVDPQLLHPLFNKPLCELLDIEGSLCLKLNTEDRREFTLAKSNSGWLLFDYMDSLPPLNYDADKFKADDVSYIRDQEFSRVSPELRQVFAKLEKMERKHSGPNESMDEFRETYAIWMELEKALLVEHTKINNEGKQRIQRQYDLFDRMIAMKFGDKPPMKFVRSDALPDAIKLINKSYKFIVAKDAGVFKVVHFEKYMDEDYEW